MSKQSLGRVSLVPKGAYNALTAYERLDVVTHNGASYIVLRPVQGVTPVDGEDYMLLVQDGDTPDLSVGSVTTLAAGSKATASIGGTADKPVLNFGIPKGDTGAAPVLKMGKVTTLEPGSEATASLSGTAEEPELNLSIPRGASGGGELPILYAATLEEATATIIVDKDPNGNPISLSAWDILLYVPGGTTYETPFYIYAIAGDYSGFSDSFVANDSGAANSARYFTVGDHFVGSFRNKYTKSPATEVDALQYYANGVKSTKIQLYTYNIEKPFPVGTYVEVRGK